MKPEIYTNTQNCATENNQRRRKSKLKISKKLKGKKSEQNIEEIVVNELSPAESAEYQIQEIHQKQKEFNKQMDEYANEIDNWFTKEKDKIEREKAKFLSKMMLGFEEE